MKVGFSEPQRTFDSSSQNARVLTETWVADAIYCPNCGNPRLNQFAANLPVADFFCANCNDQFELKSQKKAFGRKLANGAYGTKLQRLKSDTSPNLILLQYDLPNSTVRSVCMIPKRFFVPSIVEKRPPLGPKARRAGWVGSNILLERIPNSGRIYVVDDGKILPKDDVLTRWRKTAFLDAIDQSARGWLVEVMHCVDKIKKPEFSLDEVYQYESDLRSLYPKNRNVRPKIRQQLQFLRDNGYIEFLGSGHYRVINNSD